MTTSMTMAMATAKTMAKTTNIFCFSLQHIHINECLSAGLELIWSMGRKRRDEARRWCRALREATEAMRWCRALWSEWSGRLGPQKIFIATRRGRFALVATVWVVLAQLMPDERCKQDHDQVPDICKWARLMPGRRELANHRHGRY